MSSAKATREKYPKFTNCPPGKCGICESLRDFYAKRRHSHPDDVTCIEAGIAGHPDPWKEDHPSTLELLGGIDGNKG